ncbi:hypothetical protein [Phaffia rhodozyma]|uniref:Uncharacterized protein n=1 Tax=Phaffia rhodozyma TaxID=264483 RepID=A0A0F7SW33_PHARH|nr:hypothetical protein [Phaffia rhodozyma]
MTIFPYDASRPPDKQSERTSTVDEDPLRLPPFDYYTSNLSRSPSTLSPAELPTDFGPPLDGSRTDYNDPLDHLSPPYAYASRHVDGYPSEKIQPGRQLALPPSLHSFPSSSSAQSYESTTPIIYHTDRAPPELSRLPLGSQTNHSPPSSSTGPHYTSAPRNLKSDFQSDPIPLHPLTTGLSESTIYNWEGKSVGIQQDWMHNDQSSYSAHPMSHYMSETPDGFHQTSPTFPRSSLSPPPPSPTPDASIIASKSKTVPPGRLRSYVPGSLVTRLFVILVIIQTLADLAIEGFLLYQYYQLNTSFHLSTGSAAEKRLPVYLGIFGLAHLYLLLMALDAVQGRNVIQIFGIVVFNAMFLGYSIIQIDEIRIAFGTTFNADATSLVNGVPVLLLTSLIPAMIGLCEIGYIILSWFIYKEFGWDVYKALGADRRLKKSFFHYNVFICLCKFDLFFFLGFSFQMIYLVLSKDWEYYLTIAACPFTILLLVLGWMSARYEHRLGLGAFLVGLAVGLGYFILKTVRIWQQIGLSTIIKSLTVFSALAMSLLIVTFIFTVVIWRSFGMGLKEGLDRRAKHDKERRKQGSSSTELSDVDRA